VGAGRVRRGVRVVFSMTPQRLGTMTGMAGGGGTGGPLSTDHAADDCGWPAFAGFRAGGKVWDVTLNAKGRVCRWREEGVRSRRVKELESGSSGCAGVGSRSGFRCESGAFASTLPNPSRATWVPVRQNYCKGRFDSSRSCIEENCRFLWPGISPRGPMRFQDVRLRALAIS